MAVMETCPLCGSGNIYVSLGKVECPNPDCTNFSARQTKDSPALTHADVWQELVKLSGEKKITFDHYVPAPREASDEMVRMFKERVKISGECPACDAGIPVKEKIYWTEQALRMQFAKHRIGKADPESHFRFTLRKNKTQDDAKD